MSIYSEKLKDLRWQKLRKTILKRDKYICRSCCANDKELHVHHIVYFKGLQPWEYSKSYLFTLCDSCHETIHTGKILTLFPRTKREAGTSPRLIKSRMAVREK